MKKVLVLIDSDTNKHVADRAVEVFERYSIDCRLEVAPGAKQYIELRELVKESDADVLICVAGLAAPLPALVASITSKPIIGVPCSQKLNGLDALLSMSQLPAGLPVATVGIDNAKNAAYLALRILMLKYPDILTESPSSYSPEPEYGSETPSTPTEMPDFMTSTKPEDPVTFDEPVKGPAARKRGSGDWWE